MVVAWGGLLEALTEHFVPCTELVLWVCPVNNYMNFSLLSGGGGWGGREMGRVTPEPCTL